MDYTGYKSGELYHYTTLEGLMGIVENRTIRLTDYRFLNDPAELNFGLEQLENELSDLLHGNEDDVQLLQIKKSIDDLRNGVGRLIKTIDANDGDLIYRLEYVNDSKYYVLSMTHKSDDLQMWQAYGKTGCRLHFDEIKLKEYFNDQMNVDVSDSVTHQMGNVKYGWENQIKDMCKFASQYREADMVYDFVPKICTITKREEFSYEDEFRVVLHAPDRKLAHYGAKKIFVLKGQTIIPQMEISDFPINDILLDVIISPFNISDCAEFGMKEFLFDKLGKDVPVTKSAIKFRQY